MDLGDSRTIYSSSSSLSSSIPLYRIVLEAWFFSNWALQCGQVIISRGGAKFMSGILEMGSNWKLSIPKRSISKASRFERSTWILERSSSPISLMALSAMATRYSCSSLSKSW